MEQKSIKVLIADDHTLFRKGLSMMVQTFPGVESVENVENGQLALDVLKNEHIDILLLDLEMPVLDGRETAKKVVSKFPDTHIIMISMHDSLALISDLIEIGVHSYLLKSAEPEEVQKAIVSVLNNDFYYNQLVARALHQKVKHGGVSKPFFNDKSQLTKREIEILELICQELTMKQIGEKLFISEQTIHTHRKNLMRKTDCKNAVGLVKFAIQNQIVSL
ncbi:response regulator transcription factor [Marinoscillum furvescens]|uniref:LuxR family two component transcriptional regulator n=1 Tax=Marinoscillum furvescens DSM 4134 TaxID=1122208 RepID=A0A3D9KZ15_MARFU|nr:response regulator transcription factor [Marinoscillum furvescens]RED94123.1 LuxR family two component transcriptional regulator [Marinoscillum furvescens DSM 4134]